MNITSNTNYPGNGTRKLVEKVVPPQSVAGEGSSLVGQAEVLWVKWLMLLQLPIHPGKLQGPMVEVLILFGEGQLRAEQGPEER